MEILENAWADFRGKQIKSLGEPRKKKNGKNNRPISLPRFNVITIATWSETEDIPEQPHIGKIPHTNPFFWSVSPPTKKVAYRLIIGTPPGFLVFGFLSLKMKMQMEMKSKKNKK
jgi:hypothetical protein